MNWYMSTTAMESVTVNVTYISYYSEDDDTTMEMSLDEILEQPNTTITDYAVI
jgi:hypothetical protein